MKKTFKYFGLFLSVVLMGAFTACNIVDIDDSAEIGLGIKVFFPTKVVAGQPMTINGSCFSDVTEVVFPDGVSVTNFELVSNEMIRVTAPSGISAEGGKIKVRTSSDESESRVALTVGNTVVSGYSKQEGEEVEGGTQITVYGKDLEFINGIELLDPDGNPYILQDKDFYRKGTSSVVITIPPKNIYEGSFVATLHTFDGKTFFLPELAYKPASNGGHWETVKTVIWKNDGSHGEINWSGDYRFAPEFNSTGEEIYAVPADIWEKMKTQTFYMTAKGSDWIQMRITTGWWTSPFYTGDNDVCTGSELIIDNGDGTFTFELNFEGWSTAELLDAQHLLFTGGGYTPLELYFSEDIWIEGGGHSEIVKTSIWKTDGSKGAVSWSGDYRFAPEFNTTGEEIYAIPADIWEKMKTSTFYMTMQGDNPQIRVTTGWWSTTWTGVDIQPGNELLTDNGDGTFTLKINFEGDPILDVLDAQHLLFTGDRFTPIELYFEEEIWVEGGDTKKENVVWETDGSKGAVSWSGDYRFAPENNVTGEEIYAFPLDVWERLKSGTFYMTMQGDNPQIRVTTGWWSTTWTGVDIQPGNELLTDNGDGTFTLEINFEGDPILDVLDAQHLLFTGDRFTPLKIFYY